MKVSLFSTLGLFALGAFTIAVADPCGGGLTQLTTDTAISSLLDGNTICTSDSQEQHRAGNELWDYKKGASDSVDPTAQVGNWSVSGGKVSYTYGTDTYNNDVYTNGTAICFDNGTTQISATKISGITGPCPGF